MSTYILFLIADGALDFGSNYCKNSFSDPRIDDAAVLVQYCKCA